MIAVCGKCNVAIEVHPVANCPYEYVPIYMNGRRYGWNVVPKKKKTENGENEKALPT